MEFQEFPKWKYHRTLSAKLVSDPEQEAALGEGWVDNPGVFNQPVEVGPSAVEPLAETAKPEAEIADGAHSELASPRPRKNKK